jgi:hypothetical protein
MRSKITAYQNNDQIITVEGLTGSTGSPITGASLTGTVVNPQGTVLATITFADVEGTPGNYNAALPSASIPTAAGPYTFVITGSAGGLNLKTSSDLYVLGNRDF